MILLIPKMSRKCVRPKCILFPVSPNNSTEFWLMTEMVLTREYLWLFKNILTFPHQVKYWKIIYPKCFCVISAILIGQIGQMLENNFDPKCFSVINGILGQTPSHLHVCDPLQIRKSYLGLSPSVEYFHHSSRWFDFLTAKVLK